MCVYKFACVRVSLCVCVSRCLCEVMFLWALCVCGCILCVCTEVPPPRDTKQKDPRRWSQDGGWGRAGGQDPAVRRKCGSWEGICFSRPRSSPTSLMTPNKRQTAGSRLDLPPAPCRGPAGVKWAHPAETEVLTAPSAAAGKSAQAGQRRAALLFKTE